MTDEEKLDIFQASLEKIESKSIRLFTEYCIVRFPDYFWTIEASPSGKHHGGELLVDHVLDCLFMANKVNVQFEKHWTQRQKDQLISALILHDGWKCGYPGKERAYTEEDVERKGLSKDRIGVFRTDIKHPEVGYRQVLKLAQEFNQNNGSPLAARDLSMIGKGVRYHYGPWMDVENRPFSLSWPYDSVVTQVHNIDYHVTFNATLWCGKKEKENATS